MPCTLLCQRADAACTTKEFGQLCANVRHARRIVIFVGSNDISTTKTTPDAETDRVVRNLLTMVRTLWKVVHPSTSNCLVDIWKRKVSAA